MSMQQIMFASLASGGDFIIEGSGLFDGSSGYLSRTPSSAGNRQTFILDIICKRSKLGADERIFEAQVDGNNFIYGYWRSDNTLEFSQYTDPGYDFRYNTNQVFRDVASYMNLRFEVDTTAGTGERVKIFLNGTRITSFATATEPSVNFSTDWNTTNPHYIGYSSAGSGQYFTGYASRFVNLDGQTSGSMAELTDDGFWQINSASDLDYTGTNSFLIEGGANVAAGTDSSSNVIVYTSPESITSASSLYSGDTGSYTLTGDDVVCTSGDTAIYTTDAYTGVVDLQFDCVGSWSQAIFGFAKQGFTFASSAAAGTNGNTDGASIYNNNTTSFLHFGDWSNTTIASGSGETASADHGLMAGETCNFIRRADGTVILKIGGETQFTGTDSYTGPIHIYMSSHGGISTPLTMNNITITADGIAGNNFTKTGTITDTNDSPTNDADDGYGNYCTLNPIDKDSHTVTYSNGNKTALWGANAWGESRGTFSIPKSATGKFYVEFKMDVNGGTNLSVGIKGSDEPVAGITGIAWRTNGTVYDGNGGTSTETTYTTNDIIGLEFDMDNDVVKGYKNSASVVDWTLTDKMAGGNEMEGDSIVVRVRNYATGEKVTMRTDPVDWEYQPSGTIPWNTANLPTPTIINPDDHFHSQIVAKSGTTTTFTLPSWITTYEYLIIIKNISGSVEKWYWLDSLKGITKYWSSDSTAAYTTDSNVLTVSGTTGTLGSTLTSGKNYLIEIHKAGLASETAANEDGSINTTETSVNTTSGFAISKFTGTGSNATIGHGLSSKPEWIIHKDNGANQGTCYHVGSGATKYLLIDSTQAATANSSVWNDTEPTSSLISMGTSGGVNNSAEMISYAWHSSSIQSFGSYEGNGNADGPMISTGMSIGSLMVKVISTTNDWSYITSSIDTVNEADQTIRPNTTGIIADKGHFDLVSNGFKLRNTNGMVNAAQTYIYGAWGGQPMTDGSVDQSRAR